MSTATLTHAVPGSYDRISRFRVDRDGVSAEITRGCDRQYEDNTNCAVAMGLGTPARYNDEDRSASQFATKVRDDWVRLLADLRSGKLTHVLVWLFDRAFRTTEDCEALLAACRAGGALIVQTAGNPTIADPHSPDDIFRLKLAGLLAEYEIAKMSMRQRRHKLANAKLGKPNGGVRTFGYTDAGMAELHPAESVAVQQVVAQVLGGASLRSQAAWLNSMSLLGVRGAAWTGGNLGRYLLRPALAGVRVHGTDVYTGDWPPLITKGQHHQLTGLLGDPARRKNSASTNVRKRRFTGLLLCGKEGCGRKLRSGPYRSRAKADFGAMREAYRCTEGCTHKSLELVEEAVLAAAAAYLERLRPDGLLRSPEHATELASLATETTQLHARVERARADYKAELIDAALYNETVGEARARLLQVQGLRAELLQAHTVLADVAGRADARELLEAMPVDRLRTVIAHLAVVHVDPGKGVPFHPGMVRFEWLVGA